jgi:hypothetical protein
MKGQERGKEVAIITLLADGGVGIELSPVTCLIVLAFEDGVFSVSALFSFGYIRTL